MSRQIRIADTCGWTKETRSLHPVESVKESKTSTLIEPQSSRLSPLLFSFLCFLRSNSPSPFLPFLSSTTTLYSPLVHMGHTLSFNHAFVSSPTKISTFSFFPSLFTRDFPSLYIYTKLSTDIFTGLNCEPPKHRGTTMAVSYSRKRVLSHLFVFIFVIASASQPASER